MLMRVTDVSEITFQSLGEVIIQWPLPILKIQVAIFRLEEETS
jgi:hypothetical protein